MDISKSSLDVDLNEDLEAEVSSTCNDNVREEEIESERADRGVVSSDCQPFIVSESGERSALIHEETRQSLSPDTSGVVLRYISDGDNLCMPYEAQQSDLLSAQVQDGVLEHENVSILSSDLGSLTGLSGTLPNLVEEISLAENVLISTTMEEGEFSVLNWDGEEVIDMASDTLGLEIEQSVSVSSATHNISLSDNGEVDDTSTSRGSTFSASNPDSTTIESSEANNNIVPSFNEDEVSTTGSELCFVSTSRAVSTSTSTSGLSTIKAQSDVPTSHNAPESQSLNNIEPAPTSEIVPQSSGVSTTSFKSKKTSSYKSRWDQPPAVTSDVKIKSSSSNSDIKLTSQINKNVPDGEHLEMINIDLSLIKDNKGNVNGSGISKPKSDSVTSSKDTSVNVESAIIINSSTSEHQEFNIDTTTRVQSGSNRLIDANPAVCMPPCTNASSPTHEAATTLSPAEVEINVKKTREDILSSPKERSLDPLLNEAATSSASTFDSADTAIQLQTKYHVTEEMKSHEDIEPIISSVKENEGPKDNIANASDSNIGKCKQIVPRESTDSRQTRNNEESITHITDHTSDQADNITSSNVVNNDSINSTDVTKSVMKECRSEGSNKHQEAASSSFIDIKTPAGPSSMSKETCLSVSDPEINTNQPTMNLDFKIEQKDASCTDVLKMQQVVSSSNIETEHEVVPTSIVEKEEQVVPMSGSQKEHHIVLQSDIQRSQPSIPSSTCQKEQQALPEDHKEEECLHSIGTQRKPSSLEVLKSEINMTNSDSATTPKLEVEQEEHIVNTPVTQIDCVVAPNFCSVNKQTEPYSDLKNSQQTVSSCDLQNESQIVTNSEFKDNQNSTITESVVFEKEHANVELDINKECPSVSGLNIEKGNQIISDLKMNKKKECVLSSDHQKNQPALLNLNTQSPSVSNIMDTPSGSSQCARKDEQKLLPEPSKNLTENQQKQERINEKVTRPDNDQKNQSGPDLNIKKTLQGVLKLDKERKLQDPNVDERNENQIRLTSHTQEAFQAGPISDVTTKQQSSNSDTLKSTKDFPSTENEKIHHLVELQKEYDRESSSDRLNPEKKKTNVKQSLNLPNENEDGNNSLQGTSLGDLCINEKLSVTCSTLQEDKVKNPNSFVVKSSDVSSSESLQEDEEARASKSHSDQERVKSATAKSGTMEYLQSVQNIELDIQSELVHNNELVIKSSSGSLKEQLYFPVADLKEIQSTSSTPNMRLQQRLQNSSAIAVQQSVAAVEFSEEQQSEKLDKVPLPKCVNVNEQSTKSKFDNKTEGLEAASQSKNCDEIEVLNETHLMMSDGTDSVPDENIIPSDTVISSSKDCEPQLSAVMNQRNVVAHEPRKSDLQQSTSDVTPERRPVLTSSDNILVSTTPTDGPEVKSDSVEVPSKSRAETSALLENNLVLEQASPRPVADFEVTVDECKESPEIVKENCTQHTRKSVANVSETLDDPIEVDNSVVFEDKEEEGEDKEIIASFTEDELLSYLMPELENSTSQAHVPVMSSNIALINIENKSEYVISSSNRSHLSNIECQDDVLQEIDKEAFQVKDWPRIELVPISDDDKIPKFEMKNPVVGQASFESPSKNESGDKKLPTLEGKYGNKVGNEMSVTQSDCKIKGSEKASLVSEFCETKNRNDEKLESQCLARKDNIPKTVSDLEKIEFVDTPLKCDHSLPSSKIDLPSKSKTSTSFVENISEEDLLPTLYKSSSNESELIIVEGKLSVGNNVDENKELTDNGKELCISMMPESQFETQDSVEHSNALGVTEEFLKEDSAERKLKLVTNSSIKKISEDIVKPSLGTQIGTFEESPNQTIPESFPINDTATSTLPIQITSKTASNSSTVLNYNEDEIFDDVHQPGESENLPQETSKPQESSFIPSKDIQKSEAESTTVSPKSKSAAEKPEKIILKITKEKMSKESHGTKTKEMRKSTLEGQKQPDSQGSPDQTTHTDSLINKSSIEPRSTSEEESVAAQAKSSPITLKFSKDCAKSGAVELKPDSSEYPSLSPTPKHGKSPQIPTNLTKDEMKSEKITLKLKKDFMKFGVTTYKDVKKEKRKETNKPETVAKLLSPMDSNTELSSTSKSAELPQLSSDSEQLNEPKVGKITFKLKKDTTKPSGIVATISKGTPAGESILQTKVTGSKKNEVNVAVSEDEPKVEKLTLKLKKDSSHSENSPQSVCPAVKHGEGTSKLEESPKLEKITLKLKKDLANSDTVTANPSKDRTIAYNQELEDKETVVLDDGPNTISGPKVEKLKLKLKKEPSSETVTCKDKFTSEIVESKQLHTEGSPKRDKITLRLRKDSGSSEAGVHKDSVVTSKTIDIVPVEGLSSEKEEQVLPEFKSLKERYLETCTSSVKSFETVSSETVGSSNSKDDKVEKLTLKLRKDSLKADGKESVTPDGTVSSTVSIDKLEISPKKESKLTLKLHKDLSRSENISGKDSKTYSTHLFGEKTVNKADTTAKDDHKVEKLTLKLKKDPYVNTPDVSSTSGKDIHLTKQDSSSSDETKVEKITLKLKKESCTSEIVPTDTTVASSSLKDDNKQEKITLKIKKDVSKSEIHSTTSITGDKKVCDIVKDGMSKTDNKGEKHNLKMKKDLTKVGSSVSDTKTSDILKSSEHSTLYKEETKRDKHTLKHTKDGVTNEIDDNQTSSDKERELLEPHSGITKDDVRLGRITLKRSILSVDSSDADDSVPVESIESSLDDPKFKKITLTLKKTAAWSVTKSGHKSQECIESRENVSKDVNKADVSIEVICKRPKVEELIVSETKVVTNIKQTKDIKRNIEYQASKRQDTPKRKEIMERASEEEISNKKLKADSLIDNRFTLDINKDVSLTLIQDTNDPTSKVTGMEKLDTPEEKEKLSLEGKIREILGTKASSLLEGDVSISIAPQPVVERKTPERDIPCITVLEEDVKDVKLKDDTFNIVPSQAKVIDTVNRQKFSELANDSLDLSATYIQQRMGEIGNPVKKSRGRPRKTSQPLKAMVPLLEVSRPKRMCRGRERPPMEELMKKPKGRGRGRGVKRKLDGREPELKPGAISLPTLSLMMRPESNVTSSVDISKALKVPDVTFSKVSLLSPSQLELTSCASSSIVGLASSLSSKLPTSATQTTMAAKSSCSSSASSSSQSTFSLLSKPTAQSAFPALSSSSAQSVLPEKLTQSLPHKALTSDLLSSALNSPTRLTTSVTAQSSLKTSLTSSIFQPKSNIEITHSANPSITLPLLVSNLNTQSVSRTERINTPMETSNIFPPSSDTTMQTTKLSTSMTACLSNSNNLPTIEGQLSSDNLSASITSSCTTLSTSITHSVTVVPSTMVITTPKFLSTPSTSSVTSFLSNTVQSSSLTMSAPSLLSSCSVVSNSIPVEPVCPLGVSTVQVFEEETRMSAESGSRSQTPARALPSSGVGDGGGEESQGSAISTATTESVKKKGRMEVGDGETKEFTVEQIAEYQWPVDKGGEHLMVQEQISEYLGVKSFKRKYPDLRRRAVEAEEKTYLREKGLVSESMCDMGLTAVISSEVLDVMYADFQEKYEEYRRFVREKQSKELTVKQKAAAGASSIDKSKQDSKEKAISSAAAWNSKFNKSRRDERRCCFDLQTFTIHFPRNKNVKMAPKEVPKPGHYPVSLIPGQFQDFYKSYTPAELRYFPLNTVLYGPMKPNERHEPNGGSDGSQSESEDSSSSDDSSSSSSEATQDTEETSSTVGDGDGEGGQEQGSGDKEREAERDATAICKVCSGNKSKNKEGRPEVLIHCAQCTSSGHPSCLDLTLDMVPHIRRYDWQCTDCKTCIQCKDPADEDKMLFCDMCDRGYHIYCVGLRRVPSGRWHCKECAVCGSCGTQDPGGHSDASNSNAQWQHEYKKGEKGTRVYAQTLCVPCSKVL